MKYQNKISRKYRVVMFLAHHPAPDGKVFQFKIHLCIFLKYVLYLNVKKNLWTFLSPFSLHLTLSIPKEVESRMSKRKKYRESIVM